MKIVVNKLVGDLGEQWSVEVPVGNDLLKAKDPVAAIEAQMEPVLRVVDNRLLALNMRLLDSNRMAQALSPEAMLALRQTVEVMYGSRVPPEGPQRPPEPVKQATQDPVGAEKVALALERAMEATDEGGR